MADRTQNASLQFLIFQGSVATRLRCGGNLNNSFIYTPSKMLSKILLKFHQSQVCSYFADITLQNTMFMLYLRMTENT